jgi:hypothetical protein
VQAAETQSELVKKSARRPYPMAICGRQVRIMGNPSLRQI